MCWTAGFDDLSLLPFFLNMSFLLRKVEHVTTTSKPQSFCSELKGGRKMGAESMLQKCARLHCPGTKTKRSQIAFVVICIVLSSGYLLGLHAQSLIETCGTRTGGTKHAPLKLKRPATRLHTLIERTPPLPRGFLMLL